MKETIKYFYLERPFEARLMGEGSVDAGGPFRDVLENIATEILDQYFEPTSNVFED